jgi:hypothetical protein
MSSQIDPEPVTPPPPAKPVATRQPPPPPTAVEPSTSQPADSGHDDHAPALATAAVKQAPAWAISMLVHVVALLGMALVVRNPPTKDVAHLRG